MADAERSLHNARTMSRQGLFSFSGVVASLLLGGLVFVGCGDDDDSSPGGTGGSGGNPPGEGGSAGDRNQECDPTLTGSGGFVYVSECPEWLGTSTFPDGGPVAETLPATCGEGGQGGMGGGPGDVPALRRLCEAESDVSLNEVRPILYCLRDLVEDACAADHEAQVRGCLTRPPACEPDDASRACDDLRETCSSLGLDTCWWGMKAARNPEHVTTCFEDARAGESCDERFLRCAWGL